MYPDFVDLCERLTQRHYLSINSSLSRPSVAAFASRVDASRVHFINGALHMDERMRHGGHETFVEYVRTLRDAGFNVLVSLVMTPGMVRRFPEIFERFLAHGLVVIPKIMYGRFEGKGYPSSYSIEEKVLLRAYLKPTPGRFCNASSNVSALARRRQDGGFGSLPVRSDWIYVTSFQI